MKRFKEVNGVAIDWAKVTQFKKIRAVDEYGHKYYYIVLTMSKQSIDKIMDETFNIKQNKKLIVCEFETEELRDIVYNSWLI